MQDRPGKLGKEMKVVDCFSTILAHKCTGLKDLLTDHTGQDQSPPLSLVRGAGSTPHPHSTKVVEGQEF